MNALKEFVTKNKILVSVTGAVTMCAFMVFSIIAFAIGGTGSTNANTEKKTTSHVAENETTTELTTQPSYTGEEDSCGEETTADENEEPTTTTPAFDPDTLPYMIKVNRAANCLTVYAKGDDGTFSVPYKAITVSCGKVLGDTPLGTYQTIENYKWRKMNDASYAQYAYRIVGPILFHSVPYYTQAKNDLEWEEFNKLGSAASLGCVRMTVADAKWLMENCPIGTRVIIYDDINNPGPLGKPDTIKIPADLASKLNITEAAAKELKGWDPTDPDASNPWHAYSAKIYVPASKQITVEVGTAMEDILANLIATDTCGNDISDKIELTDNFNLDKAGVYHNVTVSVTDAIGSHAEVSIIIVVTEKQETSTSETPTTSTTEPPTTTVDSNDTTTESESDSSSEQDTTTEPDTETTTPEDETTSSEVPSESESSSDTTTAPTPEETTTVNDEPQHNKPNEPQLP